MEETLGKRIASNRKKLGITQDRLAEQLGVTAQAVSKWENDLSCPDITMLPKLAEIFGISVDALLGVASSPREEIKEAEIVDSMDEEEPDGIHFQKGNWEFRWDGGRKSYLGLAVWIILTAGWMFAANYLQISISLWGLLWTNALLVFGIFGLFPRFSIFRLGCGLIGGYYLLDAFHVIPSSLGRELLLPAGLLLFGLYLLGRAFHKPSQPHFSFTHNGDGIRQNVSNSSIGEDSFRVSVSFSEKHHVIELPLLRSGDADVNFGELTVDLTGCDKFGENCRIDADCSFGTLTILVPKTVRAEVDSDAAFGSVDIRGIHNQDVDSSVFIDADVSFGEIVIKYV